MSNREIYFNLINNNITELKKNFNKGIDIDISSGDYASTPLHYACREGNIEVVNFLIKYGADVNKENKYSTIYPLFEVINSINNIENKFLIIKSLIDNGADINKTDAFGNTLLYYAVEQEDVKLVKFLIQSGCDINKVTRGDGDSVLHYAYFQKNREIILTLIDNGANEEHINIYNKTPKDYL